MGSGKNLSRLTAPGTTVLTGCRSLTTPPAHAVITGARATCPREYVTEHDALSDASFARATTSPTMTPEGQVENGMPFGPANMKPEVAFTVTEAVHVVSR
jgi:hypothetical protein